MAWERCARAGLAAALIMLLIPPASPAAGPGRATPGTATRPSAATTPVKAVRVPPARPMSTPATVRFSSSRGPSVAMRRAWILPSQGGSRVVSAAWARALVDHYAVVHGVPLHIARNLIRTESSWRQNAVSRVGARGLTQLMPGTARWLGVNIHSTEQNIEGGMRYLSWLYRKFGRWDLALAAYNTGPTRVRRYGGVPPWTRSYVTKILRKPAVITAATPLPLAGAQYWAIEQFLATFPAGVRRSKDA